MAEIKDVHDLVGVQITKVQSNGKNYLMKEKAVRVFLGRKET